MKCANCGTKLLPSARTCGRCGKAVPQEFNYKNMEQELLNTVWEEETINGISGDAMLYQKEAGQKGMRTIKKDHGLQDMDGMDMEEIEEETEGYDGPPGKQMGKLGFALLAGSAALGGLIFFMQTFSTDYTCEKAEAEYQNCLTQMVKEDYAGALGSANLLLKGEPDSLAYLALKNTVCEKSGDSKAQMETLQQIIELDADNYQAYEKLLELYLADENQEGIEGLAENAPNSAISSMLSAYLVDTPYLELTPGVYDASQTLNITSEGGNSIYYTMDGSSPMEKGVLYSAPIPLEQDRFYSIRAVCKNERGAYGEEASGEYQIGIHAQRVITTEISQPEVYPQGGAYSTQQRITIDVPIGYQAYYSWEANATLTPQNGTLYTGGITMPEGSSVLSVIVTDGSGNSSAVKQVNYTYQP